MKGSLGKNSQLDVHHSMSLPPLFDPLSAQDLARSFLSDQEGAEIFFLFSRGSVKETCTIEWSNVRKWYTSTAIWNCEFLFFVTHTHCIVWLHVVVKIVRNKLDDFLFDLRRSVTNLSCKSNRIRGDIYLTLVWRVPAVNFWRSKHAKLSVTVHLLVMKKSVRT